ncbi:hypothetical protein Tco_0922646 [Tanacetum coccineum]|uniref:Uncharacterized protein n=1 Tax=Tanacetum coccineum TaxID=301880 RepID=A0ABQ5D085_9ASTR
MNHGSCLWTRFIEAIYGEDSALNSSSSLFKRSPWLDIISDVIALCTKGINLLDLIRKKVEATGEFSVKSVGQLIDDSIIPKEEVATRYRISTKGHKQSQIGQNRARILEEHEKTKPKAYTSLMVNPYDCPSQVPFVYNQDPCFNQNLDNFPQTSPSFPQQYLCCEDYEGPHATFQCQPMNQNLYNSSGLDQFQPSQYSVVHQPIQETNMEMMQARDNLLEAIQALLKKFDHIPPKEKPMAFLLAEDKFLKIK